MIEDSCCWNFTRVLKEVRGGGESPCFPFVRAKMVCQVVAPVCDRPTSSVGHSQFRMGWNMCHCGSPAKV